MITFFYQLVKEHRIQKNITLREFCRGVKLDPSNWSKVERGIADPPKNTDVLNKITAFLKLNEVESKRVIMAALHENASIEIVEELERLKAENEKLKIKLVSSIIDPNEIWNADKEKPYTSHGNEALENSVIKAYQKEIRNLKSERDQLAIAFAKQWVFDSAYSDITIEQSLEKYKATLPK